MNDKTSMDVVLRNLTLRDRFRLIRFRRQEDGSIIIFSLFMFVLILWFGGIAVDLMRFETTRAQLQGTLDRATLAAADLEQTLPPADVVRDYFQKAGMIDYLQGDPIVEEGVNFRRVSVNAEAEMPLLFWDLLRVFNTPFTPGVSSLTVRGASSAEEVVSDVEVSLILDVSTSMNSSNRIQNLRPAARDFVTTVLQTNGNGPQGLITVSMVPYSAVVNVGPIIAPNLNINRSHNYSTCPLFENNMFATTELDLSTRLEHVAHFDPGWHGNSTVSPLNYPWCHVGTRNSIITHSTNEQALHDSIDALRPYGNTAIDLGVKWGAALLDPSTQDLVTAAVEAGQAPEAARGRPQAYETDNVSKVLVIMTDGQNTSEYDLRSTLGGAPLTNFKWGLSRVWFLLDENAHEQSFTDAMNAPLRLLPQDRVSVQIHGEDTNSRWDDWFYYNGLSNEQARAIGGRYHQYPRGFDSRSEYANAISFGDQSQTRTGDLYVNGDNRILNARWQTLFADRTYRIIDDTYMRAAYEDNNNSTFSWREFHAPDYSINYGVVNGTEANNRLSAICAAARARGIVIYTVAFEAPSGGRAALQDCASSDSHYFDVSGTDISEAFSAIASDIRALKLTQ